MMASSGVLAALPGRVTPLPLTISPPHIRRELDSSATTAQLRRLPPPRSRKPTVPRIQEGARQSCSLIERRCPQAQRLQADGSCHLHSRTFRFPNCTREPRRPQQRRGPGVQAHAHGQGSHAHGHIEGRANDFAKLPHLDHDHDHDHSSAHSHHSRDHGHDHDHDHNHDHDHGHHHHHHGALSGSLNPVQSAIVALARATGVWRLAGLLRNSVALASLSFALLIACACVPYVAKSILAARVQTALVAAAFPLTGVPALLDAAVDLAGGKVNIHVLMALAAFASVFMGNALEGGLLLAMFSLSHSAEDYFTEKAMGDVKALSESHPEVALVLDEFDATNPPPLASLAHSRVPVEKVPVGAYLLVRAGETVPVDGTVWQGRSHVTVEHLTGEAQPLRCAVGDAVSGGARNVEGLLIVKTTKAWGDSTVARIMWLTDEARRNAPRLQRWLDLFSERYSQAVILASVAVALLGPPLFRWPFFTAAGVTGSIYRALGLMVAASPCALAVAPLAYATAVSACASKGILLKGGHALDALAACDTVAFDKTGTLTTGELVCKVIEPVVGHELAAGGAAALAPGGGQAAPPECCSPSCEMEALAVAAAMEQAATHPIARAVLNRSAGVDLPAVAVADFETVPGQGLAATVTSLGREPHLAQQARLGSVEYIAQEWAGGPESQQRIRDAAGTSRHGGSELVRAALSVDDKVTLFHFEDKVRPGAAAVLSHLRERAGLKLLMLTGDHAASAQRVADEVGIGRVFANLRPENKLRHVEALAAEAAKKGRGGLVMVGDGINDAPALAAATVGVVLAERASATAVAAADVLLLRSDLEGVSFVIAKALQTTNLVKQSVALALACIFVASFPAVLGFLPLWLTVLLHEGGTLLVCLNSARAFNQPTLSSGTRTRWIGSLFSKLLKVLKRDRDWQVPSHQDAALAS